MLLIRQGLKKALSPTLAVDSNYRQFDNVGHLSISGDILSYNSLRGGLSYRYLVSRVQSHCYTLQSAKESHSTTKNYRVRLSTILMLRSLAIQMGRQIPLQLMISLYCHGSHLSPYPYFDRLSHNNNPLVLYLVVMIIKSQRAAIFYFAKFVQALPQNKNVWGTY